MSKPKLLLHIGHSKCGSTSIQRYLLRNQQVLLKNGVYLFGNNLDISRDCKVKAAPNAFLAEEENWRAAAEKISRASEGASSKNTFILSAEVLCQPKFATFVQQFSNHFDIQILHYIRNQADWCYSAWKQWQLKRGKDLTSWVDHCAKKSRPDYWGTFSAFMDVGFDEQKYNMRVLSRSLLHNGDLLDDFCIEAGLDEIPLNKPIERSNPNMDHAILDVLKSSEFLFEDSHDNKIFSWILDYFPEQLTSIRSTLSQTQRVKILTAHYESNNRIFEQFFRAQKQLFWDVFSADSYKFKGDPVGEGHGDQLERLRRALGYTIGALATEHQKSLFRIESAESKIQSLERKIKDLEAGV